MIVARSRASRGPCGKRLLRWSEPRFGRVARLLKIMAAARPDPDAQPLTPEQLAKMRRVSRVKVLRQRLGMTQAEFADAFRLPITTLRDWEQTRARPTRRRALLRAIERDPDVMRRLLGEPA